MDDVRTASVVLVSMGSLADTKKMLLEMKEAFLGAFIHFSDVQFIWKFTRNKSDVLENGLFESAPNVHPFDWVEQKEILGKIISQINQIKYKSLFIAKV